MSNFTVSCGRHESPSRARLLEVILKIYGLFVKNAPDIALKIVMCYDSS